MILLVIPQPIILSFVTHYQIWTHHDWSSLWRGTPRLTASIPAVGMVSLEIVTITFEISSLSLLLCESAPSPNITSFTCQRYSPEFGYRSSLWGRPYYLHTSSSAGRGDSWTPSNSTTSSIFHLIWIGREHHFVSLNSSLLSEGGGRGAQCIARGVFDFRLLW